MKTNYYFLLGAAMLCWSSSLSQVRESREKLFAGKLQQYKDVKLEKIKYLPDNFTVFENSYLRMTAHHDLFEGFIPEKKNRFMETMFIYSDQIYNTINLGDVYSGVSILNDPSNPTKWLKGSKDLRLIGDLNIRGITISEKNESPNSPNKFRPYVEDIIIDDNTMQDYVHSKLDNRARYSSYSYSSINIAQNNSSSNYNLGANLSLPKTTFEISFSSNSEEQISTCDISFYVNLYDASFKLDSVMSTKSLENLQATYSTSFNPVYVSNISYGYIATLRVTGIFTMEQIKSALNMSYSIAGANAKNSQQITVSKLDANVITGGMGYLAVEINNDAILKKDLSLLISSFNKSLESRVNYLLSNGEGGSAIPLGVKFSYLYDNETVQMGRLIADDPVKYSYRFKFLNDKNYYTFNFNKFQGYSSPPNDRINVFAWVIVNYDQDRFATIINNLPVFKIQDSKKIDGLKAKNYDFSTLKSSLIQAVNFSSRIYSINANQIENTKNGDISLYNETVGVNNTDPNSTKGPWLNSSDVLIPALEELVNVEVHIGSICLNQFVYCGDHNEFYSRSFKGNEVRWDGDQNVKSVSKTQYSDNGQYKIYYYWKKK